MSVCACNSLPHYCANAKQLAQGLRVWGCVCVSVGSGGEGAVGECVLVPTYMCTNMCLFACLDRKVCVRGGSGGGVCVCVCEGGSFYEFKLTHVCL